MYRTGTMPLDPCLPCLSAHSPLVSFHRPSIAPAAFPSLLDLPLALDLFLLDLSVLDFASARLYLWSTSL